MLSKQELMNLSFLEARGKLLEVAAFLDRLDRCEGEEDFRIIALREVFPVLLSPNANRAQTILEKLSDTSEEPITVNPGKAACGAPLSDAKKENRNEFY